MEEAFQHVHAHEHEEGEREESKIEHPHLQKELQNRIYLTNIAARPSLLKGTVKTF